MGPEWLSSPQHVVGGFAVASIVCWAGRRWRDQRWAVALFAVGLAALAEIVVELAEYRLLYADEPHVSAYYDTLADMADTVVGGVVAAVIWLAVASSRSRCE